MTWVIQVEHPFWNIDFAVAGYLQLQECKREIDPQRNVLGQLVFTAVCVQIGFLHPSQGELQPLAGQQSFVEVIPRVIGQE